MKKTNQDIYIGIREFQHYLYCPRQWGLIQINQSWAENYYVTKANLIHNKVHTTGETIKKSKQIIYSLPVYWDKYDIYGVLDCAEIEDNNFTIIEYKPKQNKEPSVADKLQLYIQKLCINHIFSDYSIESYFYYDNTKKRIKIDFTNEEEKYWNIFTETREQIIEYKLDGTIPIIAPNQNCNGCSLKDICFPKIKIININNRIKNSLRKEI